jgi:hypothetical protein
MAIISKELKEQFSQRFFVLGSKASQSVDIVIKSYVDTIRSLATRMRPLLKGWENWRTPILEKEDYQAYPGIRA